MSWYDRHQQITRELWRAQPKWACAIYVVVGIPAAVAWIVAIFIGMHRSMPTWSFPIFGVLFVLTGLFYVCGFANSGRGGTDG